LEVYLPTPPIAAEKYAKVVELLQQGLSRDKVSELSGVSHGKVSEIKAILPSQNQPQGEIKQSEEINGDNWTISLPKTRICTLDELIEHCKIDLRIWEVERFICNKWEVGAKVNERIVAEPLFQVKAYLKKKKAVAFARAEIEALRKEALNYSPKFTGFKPRKPAGSGVAVEFSVYDHHFGGLIWGEETGGEDWDNKISLATWKDAFEDLANRVRGFNPEMAVLVLGNDQQNADNRAGSTENLTPQSMDSRYHKVYTVSKEASRWAIDKLLAEYGRVHVIMVPGNHDPLATWHLGDYLSTWYRNCPGVTIDNSVPMRKWWEYGVVMVMFEHGHKGKLPDYDRIMASEKPEMWGRTKWREAHTGDKHHKTTIENKGATIRSLSSLRPSCAWSTENHHTGSIRAAEAFAWSKTEGLIGQATYSILRKGEDAK
jgi:hypothetical protein